MDQSPKRWPAFFKVLQDDFSAILKLPPAFTADFGEHLPENPVLAIKSGKSWKVKIEEVEDHHCFTKGWPKFAKDLRLEHHDILVFWFESPAKFCVEVYGKPGQAKIVNPLTVKGKVSPKIEPDDDVFDPAPPASDDCVGPENESLWFSVDMKYSNQSRLRIPTGFMRGARRMGSMCVVLIDPKGREWPVLISRHGKSSKERSDMTKGWKDFRAANALVDGDICTFTHTETPGGWLLRVQVERVKPNTSNSVSVTPKKY